ncbi:MAG: nicotinate-nucleotide adenylyltransferase [Eubacterium sp.]|nr:nicotinate-nucleotide adenylyltransferase [Eubacterium sp.]
MEKIGLLGGTFNPIHLGHLLLAESARDQYGLDRVLFIPAGSNPFKETEREISRQARQEMVAMAIKDHPAFEMLTLELERPGRTYTIDTIRSIKRRYPQSALYFITGADIMFEVTQWKDAGELLSTVNFITTFRPGYSHRRLDNRIEELQKVYDAKIRKLCTSEMDIASSDIRDRVRRGASIRYLVPEPVRRYIAEHGLYLRRHQGEKAMTIDEMKARLQKNLKPKRYEHTLNVADCALALCDRYPCDKEQAYLAALLHDCAKNYTPEALLAAAEKYNLDVDDVTQREPQLLHGPVGAAVARDEYGVTDEAVLGAIRYHTTGRAGMSRLEKIIYLADFIEPGRDYPGVDKLRELAFEDLDKAMIQALTNTIRYITNIRGLIHQETVIARNDLILREMDAQNQDKEESR